MKKWATSIPLNWTLNEAPLNEAIANFGNVDMDGVLLLPNSEQSSCLPSRFRYNNIFSPFMQSSYNNNFYSLKG